MAKIRRLLQNEFRRHPELLQYGIAFSEKSASMTAEVIKFDGFDSYRQTKCEGCENIDVK